MYNACTLIIESNINNPKSKDFKLTKGIVMGFYSKIHLGSFGNKGGIPSTPAGVYSWREESTRQPVVRRNSNNSSKGNYV